MSKWVDYPSPASGIIMANEDEQTDLAYEEVSILPCGSLWTREPDGEEGLIASGHWVRVY